MYDEVWAVAPERIKSFFSEHAGEYTAEVSVIALPDKRLRHMMLPQTRVVISGEDAEKLYRLFYLSFMTAGG